MSEVLVEIYHMTLGDYERTIFRDEKRFHFSFEDIYPQL